MMGSIKDRNGKDITNAEEIKKRWQECTQELHKKGLNDPGYHKWYGHLDLEILECEVKWVVGSISMNTASEDDEIPAELFQILKDNAVKVMHSICHQIWKIQQWHFHRTGKCLFSFQSQRKAMP